MIETLTEEKMANIDYKKVLSHLYKPSTKKVREVDVPPMNFLMIDGKGSPASQVYADSIAVLYSLSYGLRAISKAKAIVYTVMPLEGLWEEEGRTGHEIGVLDKSNFVWTMMIMQPEHITVEMFAETCESVRKSKNPSRLNDVRFESFHEGLSLQIMHIGSYDDEPETVQRILDKMKESDYIYNGKHHEIYLSDPRKVEASKLKTIIRYPIRTK
jgi:hypothetical protein